MNGATLQQKVYYGYAKSAQYIGTAYTQYRPSGPSNPLQIALQTINASFNAEDMTYSKPRGYAKATWYALLDGTQAQVGDYLVGADGTFFIAAMQQIKPILAVQCNATLNFTRAQEQTQFGQVSNYEGTTAANETPLMTGFPASVLQGTKGEKGPVDLPGDARLPWWLILAPYVAGVTLQSNDLIADATGRRFIISSAELSPLGWRITAMQAKT
ncbi:hypothetical protein [Paraburkholderia phosphatilytica]|uniref:hypothetical protein n=1 Tax=Paraburkholderia phosphatilytica TaxID=2282883 RepID=UPI000E4EEA7B|nr:hypothetical protein [Paraburkholderia phosphatilytica]